MILKFEIEIHARVFDELIRIGVVVNFALAIRLRVGKQKRTGDKLVAITLS